MVYLKYKSELESTYSQLKLALQKYLAMFQQVFLYMYITVGIFGISKCPHTRTIVLRNTSDKEDKSLAQTMVIFCLIRRA